MENTRIPKIMMSYKPRGYRKPRRPLRTWRLSWNRPEARFVTVDATAGDDNDDDQPIHDFGKTGGSIAGARELSNNPYSKNKIKNIL